MDLITAVISIPAIVGFVNLMKRYGLSTQFAPLMSVAIGAIIGIVSSYLQYHFIDPSIVMFGIITGVSATGVYDVTKSETGKQDQEAAPDGIPPYKEPVVVVPATPEPTVEEPTADAQPVEPGPAPVEEATPEPSVPVPPVDAPEEVDENDTTPRG